MRSKITDKFQTTVPKEIREKLKISRNDYIEWKYSGGMVIVEPVQRPFLKYRGSIHAGTGDIKTDILKARENCARKK